MAGMPSFRIVVGIKPFSRDVREEEEASNGEARTTVLVVSDEEDGLRAIDSLRSGLAMMGGELVRVDLLHVERRSRDKCECRK